MKRLSWKMRAGVSLVVLSALLYVFHYLVFRNTHQIFNYLLIDLAFLPIEVLIVTLIIAELLSERERRSMLKKLNMVIGAFFSEVGGALLKAFIGMDAGAAEKREKLSTAGRWKEEQAKELVAFFKGVEYTVGPAAGDFEKLRGILVGKRGFLLGLLENPNLLEHESFTEMLWAVFHLTEELEAREDFSRLPASDVAHLKGDSKRAYGAITVEWLFYMEHLRKNYPYLFSLAVRTNPFDASASVIVT